MNAKLIEMSAANSMKAIQPKMKELQERHKNDIYWRLHIWLPVNAILRGFVLYAAAGRLAGEAAPFDGTHT